MSRGINSERQGFTPMGHFASGLVSKCAICEQLGESSWPAKWALMSDGFLCPDCLSRPISSFQTEDDLASV